MQFIVPKKLSELLKIIPRLTRGEGSVKIYFAAGTTDLYVQQKDGILKEPNIFIDISNISELKKISLKGKTLHIGAAVTFSEIIKNPLCNKIAPLLVSASKEIGSPLIRNRATIGGNIANSSPAGDSIPPLVCLGATAVLRYDSRTTRKIPVEKFFIGPKKNILKNGELIEKIIIPSNDFNFYRFLKLGSRKALAISKVSLSLAAKTDGKRFQKVQIAAGAVGPTVIRCLNTEKFLTEAANTSDKETIKKAKEILSSEISPIDDFRSEAVYRREATAALLEEILLELTY